MGRAREDIIGVREKGMIAMTADKIITLNLPEFTGRVVGKIKTLLNLYIFQIAVHLYLCVYF
jgi:hypothetical protein